MPGVIRVPAMVAILSAVMRLPAQAADSPTVVIRVLDNAYARASVLIEAQHHVTRVFGVAGVHVVWREGAADAPDLPVQVTVVILPDATTPEKSNSEKISRAVLGMAAPPPAHRAWIFLRRLEEAASRQGQSLGLILGHVIVHEVAHMIAHVEHSAAGVMAPTLQLRPDILSAFTREQGQLLREAILEESGKATLDARDRSRAFRVENR